MRRDLLFSLILNGFFVYLFFNTYNLWNSNPILLIDYPWYLANSRFFGEVIVKLFKSFFGYSLNSYIGIPKLQFYPIGIFIITWFFNSIGFSYEISQKIILFVILMSIGVLVYKYVNQVGNHIIGALIANLWLWIGLNSAWLNLFVYGMFSFVLSVILSFCYLYIHMKIKFDELIIRNSLFKIISLGFLLAIIFLINYMVILFLFIIIYFEFLSKYLFKKRSKTEFYFFIKFYFRVIIIFFGLIAFWIIPVFFFHISFFDNQVNMYIFSTQNTLDNVRNYFTNNMFPLIFILFILILLLLKRNLNQNYKLPLYCSVFGLIFGILFPIFKFPGFQGINSFRYLCFFEIGVAMIIGLIINDGFLLVKKYKNKISVREKKKKFFYVMLIFFFFIKIIPVFPVYSTYQSPLLGKFSDYENIKSPRFHDYSVWEDHDLDLMYWIDNNTSNQSRILFQCSSDITQRQLSGGHSFDLFVQETNRFYASGEYPIFNSSFVDDYLYGKLISDYDSNYLEILFFYYNIEYIIVWSNLAKNYFDQISQFNNVYSMGYNNSKYNVYFYQNAIRSFFIDPQNHIQVSSFELKDNQMYFKISNFTINSQYYVSFHDFVNWNVLINNTEIKKIYNQFDLISFQIAASFADRSELEIQVVWESTIIETTSIVISYTCIIFCFITIIINLKIRKQNLV